MIYAFIIQITEVLIDKLFNTRYTKISILKFIPGIVISVFVVSFLNVYVLQMVPAESNCSVLNQDATTLWEPPTRVADCVGYSYKLSISCLSFSP